MAGKHKISIETVVGAGLLFLLAASPIVVFLIRAPDAETSAIYTCAEAVRGKLSVEAAEFLPDTRSLVSSMEGGEEIFRIMGIVQSMGETGLRNRFAYSCEIRPPSTVLSVEVAPLAATRG